MTGQTVSRIRETLDFVVERFKAGDIPEAVAISMFPIPIIPASKWSLFNRVLMVLSGTSDARGFQQWKSVGRRVNKDVKAIRILAPMLKRVKKETNEEDDETRLIGFMPVPVFRVEDTEGNHLIMKK